MNVPLQTAQDGFKDLADQLSRMMDEMTQSHFVRFCPVDAWQPAVNLYETPQAFFVFVDLAGMKREQIDVQAVQNVLVVRGSRASPRPEGDHHPLHVHLMEIDHGCFCRELQVPASVDQKHIEAYYREGFLQIVLPKKET